jgi:hypothetical protein
MTGIELNIFLKKFYVDVRMKNGDYYSKNGIMNLRYGLQKHFLKIMNVDIVNDPICKTANSTYAAVLVKLKREGKGKVTHKEPLTSEDFRKLYSSKALNLNTPQGLQDKVFVDLMMHLCNRGRENLREMKRSHFKICTDSNNNRYRRTIICFLRI